MEELLSLKWNNHRSTFLHILTLLRNKQQYSDVTLACDGRFYSVHKLVLSTCSDYFSSMFDRTTECKNPIIVLKDIKCEDLEALLDYMYLGEVNVRQADLASLIKAAECLRVKGLAVPDDEPPQKVSHSDSNVRRNDGASSPPAKRKRRNEDQDGRDDVRPIGRSSPTISRQSPQSHSRLSPTLDNESCRSSPMLSDNNQNNVSQSVQDSQIKVEKDDVTTSLLDNYELTNDTFKEEPSADPGGDMSNELPEFLQQASGSSYSHSFAGPSFQPDMQNWQGDQVLSSNYSGMGFGSSQSQDGSQNNQSSGKKDRAKPVNQPRNKSAATSAENGPQDNKDEDQAMETDQRSPSKGSPDTKYRISTKSKPQKDHKVSPMVIAKVASKGSTLADFITVPDLIDSIGSILGGLNTKLLEELLLMGFPCAICKSNEIFANLEEHLSTDHNMSTKVAEDYVDVLMNKISQMFDDLKNQQQHLHIQTEDTEPEIIPVEKKRSREVIKLPLADHIFLMKYQMFLENEFSHHAPVTARIYLRSVSEIIHFLRQNGIALSEAPIKLPEDIATIVSLLLKFCESRSIYSRKTLSVKMQYFSFFMKHFYQQFYETESSLMKIFKKEICKLCTQLMNEMQNSAPFDPQTKIKGVKLKSKKLKSSIRPISSLEIKKEKLEDSDSGSKALDSALSIDLPDDQPSTSRVPKKRGRKKKKGAKKITLNLKSKTKAIESKSRVITNVPLFKNPIYRKCFALLANDVPLAHNACKVRNALLFTMSYRHNISKMGICIMTLGDFERAEWCTRKHAYVVKLGMSPKNELIYLGKNMMKYTKTWIAKYRAFLSDDDSSEAPVFVNENGSKLSGNLLSVSNRMFAKLCGLKSSVNRVAKFTQDMREVEDRELSSPLVPDINANPSKLEVKLEDIMQSKGPSKSLRSESGSPKKEDVIASSVFYTSGQNSV